MSRATCAVIHLAALRHNLNRVRQLAPNSQVMAVVKADGYGHGLERVATALQSADVFGVASIADGARIRAVGLQNRIVVLSDFNQASDLIEIRKLDLEVVVHHAAQIQLLEADAHTQPIKVWLKIESGMHRLGFPPELAAKIFSGLRLLDNVHPDITLMTHFAASDEFENPTTLAQIQVFEAAVEGLQGTRSLANSAAVLGFKQSHADCVRVGGLLYGISAVVGKTGADFGFQPAMSLTTKLLAIQHCKQGASIGYAQTWQCPEDMRVGIAAIGYGDGYPRSVPSGTPVLVDGQRAAIIGRVSMDLMAIDLRQHSKAQIDDEVILWGRGLPVETIADAAGSIGYELVCGITRRVRFEDDTSETAD